MEAQKPLFDDEKVDVGYGGSSVKNHHYIPREDFNKNNNGGGSNSENALQEKSLLARTICPHKNSNIVAKSY